MPNGKLDIRLLGSIEVEASGRRIESELRGSQGKLCFAYLVLNRERAVPRAELENAIWPVDPPSDPGAALSTLLSRLRRALGEGIVEGRSELRFAAPSGSRVDLEQATEDLAHAESQLAEGDWDGARTAAEAAEAALSLELMAGFDSPWLDEARRDQEDLRLRALEALTRVSLEQDDHEGTERAARELIRWFPYRESGHRHLMEGLARQGNTAQALRTYEDLRTMLRDELGTSPSRVTIDLHTRLLGSDEHVAAPPTREPDRSADAVPPTLRTSLDSGSPFVGRSAQIDELVSLFDSRGSGTTRLALIQGDPGIGKTRLCAELAEALAAGPARVLYGRSEEVALAQFQPFVEALGAWAVAAPQGDLVKATEDLPEAARLIPQLRRRLPNLPAPAGEVDRLIVFEDLAEMLSRVSASKPILLVLDDLHWADEPTLQLLKHLVRSPQPIDCLIVATYRITEFQSPLTDSLADLGRDGGLTELALQGLDEDDVASLVSAGTGGDANNGLARIISERSEGNPFFVSELVRGLETGGVVNGEVDHIPLSVGAAALLQRRLRDFDEDELDILSLAAVIGRDFTFELLERSSGSDPASLARLLERASEAWVAREVPGSVGRFSFDHALIRDFLDQRVGEQRRAQLHLRVAQELDEIAAGNPGPHLEQLAHHYAAGVPAGGTERAIELATLAGDQAHTMYAHERAADHYGRALELLGEGGPIGERADLLLRRGESLVRGGAIEAGRAALLEAADLARSIDDGERFAQAVLGYGDSGGSWSMRVGESDDMVVELLDQALSMVDRSSTGTRAHLSARLAGELIWADGAQERRENLGHEAVRLARDAGEPDLVSRSLIWRANSSWAPQSIDERLDLTKEALEVVRDWPDRSIVANAAMFRALVLAEDASWPGGWGAAMEIGGEGVSESRNTQLRFIFAQWGVNRALAEGRLDDAGELIGEVLALTPGFANDDPQTAAAYSGFLATRERNQLGALEGLIDEQIRLAERAPGLVSLRVVVGLALVELDRRDEALAQLAALGDDFSGLPPDSMWGGGFSHAAELIEALEDRERAATLYEIGLEARAGRLCVIASGAGMLGSMERHLGLLAFTAGDFEASAAHFERAIEVNDRKDGLLEAAHSRVDLARALLRAKKPDPIRAGELLRDALAFADERDDLDRLRSRAESAAALVAAG